MTAIEPDRCPCVRGCRYAIGVACLVVGMCCAGCGKTQESQAAPTTVDAPSSRGKGAARPAVKAPRPVATVEKPAPAPAEPAAEIVADEPEVVVNESVVVAEKPARAAERVETLEEIIDAAAEEGKVVDERPAPAAEKSAPPAEQPARVVVAEPVETPIVETVEHATPRAPESPPDHAGLAVAAMQQGDCEQALEHFRYARQASPDDLDVRLWEAQAYRHCGWPDVTLELLSELDARSRAREDVAAEIAEAHRMLDAPGQAAMAWELRYIHHPKAWRAAAHAAQAWIEAGQHKPAQWWYEQARLAAPNTPEVQALTTVIQSAAVTNR
ncbi:MAG: tetratricopeptide repeat protein [Planctomycetota bacterium]